MSLRVPRSVSEAIDELPAELASHAELARHAVARLFEDASVRLPDGSIYLSTGDIPAMWLRDSSFQVKPLLRFAADPEVYEFCAAVIRRQASYIAMDPYANAFNPAANGNCWHKDFANQSPWVFERKWEIDSLASFLDISADLATISGRRDHLDDAWLAAVASVLDTFEREQDHDPESYVFVRKNAPTHDYLSHAGYGAPFGRGTGLIWSAFRPSDDACELPFNIPQNAYAAAALRKIAPLVSGVEAERAVRIASSVTAGISEHGQNAHGYLYEVDGLGGQLFLDDANIPSLLSLPYLGYCAPEDPRYLATRGSVLSSANPWFFSGTVASHVGSAHTGAGRVWPLAMAMEVITARQPELAKLERLARTASKDGSFHESIAADDSTSITREWFSWAEMTYFDAVFATAEKLRGG